MDWLEGILYMMWRGIAIGILISAPMGPVGIMCIQRTLDKGRRDGFYTGLGAAISDLFYCLLTGFGLSFIEEFIERNQNVIQLIGSAVLIAFSIYLFRKNPARNLKKPAENRTSVKMNIIGGFLFTVSNPLILFLIIGLFARFNLFQHDIKFYHYIIGYICIFAGALLWWWVVTYFVDKVRAHFNVRSMWLINRIIGVIILIFAVVGIITGIMSMTQPASAETRYWNSARGYADFIGEKAGNRYYTGQDLPTGCIISNTTDTLSRRTVPIIPASRLTFAFRLANTHNHPTKNYKYIINDSTTGNISFPGWGIIADTSSGVFYFQFRTADDLTDITGETDMTVTAHHFPKGRDNAMELASAKLTKGFDLYQGVNAYKLIYTNGRFILSGGNRQYNPIFDVEYPGAEIKSIGFGVPPGGEIEVGDISLKTLDTATPAALSIEEIMAETENSDDPIVGFWAILDRSLEESLIRLGGDYVMAATKTGNGYRMSYIYGARRNPSFWRMGMLKCMLVPTLFPDIYNVKWTDAGGELLSHDIKCQLDGKSLNFTFPYHGSTLRLHKVNPERIQSLLNQE